MGDGQPDAGQHHPEQVCQTGAEDALLSEQPGVDEFLSERECGKPGNAECGHGEGQPDDRDGQQ